MMHSNNIVVIKSDANPDGIDSKEIYSILINDLRLLNEELEAQQRIAFKMDVQLQIVANRKKMIKLQDCLHIDELAAQ